MKQSMLLVSIIGIAVLLLCLTITTGHNYGGDFSSYIMQAKSITEQDVRGFIDANRYTILKSSYPIGPVAYPWGFPVMLAPVYSVFGMNMIALKSVVVVCYLLFLLLLWFGFRKYHTHCWLVCLVCLFSLNPSMIAFCDNIISDIPFMLFSTFSIFFIGQITVEKRNIISCTLDSILLGISIACAFLVRTSGILILVTLGITQMIALILKSPSRIDQHTNNVSPMLSVSLRRFFAIGNFSIRGLFLNMCPYIIFFCVTLAWTMILPEGGSYQLSHNAKIVSLSTIKRHIIYYIDLPSKFLAGVPRYYLLYGMSIPLYVVGLTRRYKTDYHIIVYILLTFLFYVAWPELQGLRFLFPVLPFFFSFVLTGLSVFEGGTTVAERVFRKTICLLPILLILSFFAVRSLSGAYVNVIQNHQTMEGPFTETSMSMFEFIRRNTEKDSVVVFFKPRVMRMMTGRKSIMLTKMEELALSRGDYLCLFLPKIGPDSMYVASRVSPFQVSPNVIIGKRNIEPVYENNEYKIYRLAEILNEKGGIR
jgi:hypothetical protein